MSGYTDPASAGTPTEGEDISPVWGVDVQTDLEWLKAQLLTLVSSASPAFTGSPTAPTPVAGDDSTKLATTGYADSAVGVEKTRAEAAEILLAPLASPALTGAPTAPTTPTADNTTKLATTAFVHAQSSAYVGGSNPVAITQQYTASVGDYVKANAVNMNSPIFTDGATTNGSPTFTSATAGFSAVNVGQTMQAPGVPTGAVILSVQSATSVTLSQNATATASGLSVTIQPFSGSQYMDKYGFRGTTLPIVEGVGETGYMTLAQIRQLRDQKGWDVGAHAATFAAHNDLGYPGLSAAQLQTDIETNKDWLAANGFPANTFAYPRGLYNDTVRAACQAAYPWARTTSGWAETWPPGDNYRVRTIMHSNGISLSQSKALVDQAISANAWIILTFHKLAPTAADGITWDIASFNALMDYLNTVGITVKTAADVMAS